MFCERLNGKSEFKYNIISVMRDRATQKSDPSTWRSQRHCRLYDARVVGGIGLVSLLVPISRSWWAAADVQRSKSRLLREVRNTYRLKGVSHEKCEVLFLHCNVHWH